MNVASTGPSVSRRNGERTSRGPRFEMAIFSVTCSFLLRLHQLPRRVRQPTPDHAQAAGAGQYLASVHVYHLAVDVPGRIADEERAQVRNLLQRAEAMQGVVLQQRLLQFSRGQQARERSLGA